MKIEVNSKGVFADGNKIDNVTRVDVINLSPVADTEVVIHIAANEIEVDHKNMKVRE